MPTQARDSRSVGRASLAKNSVGLINERIADSRAPLEPREVRWEVAEEKS